jgi:hypothetical protein
MRIAIYSTYCGSTENRTIVQQTLNQDFPHYFFSNNPQILRVAQELGWAPVLLKLEVSEDPVVSAHQAKIAKAVPHLFPSLKNYDFLFYIDDKIPFDAAKVPALIRALEKDTGAMAVRPQALFSGNVLYEFGQAMLQPRYKSQWSKTVGYITQELKEGFTLECQLYWTSAILRDMHHPDTERINSLWYEHINRCGTECQISFNFVAQRFTSIRPLSPDLSG